MRDHADRDLELDPVPAADAAPSESPVETADPVDAAEVADDPATAADTTLDPDGSSDGSAAQASPARRRGVLIGWFAAAAMALLAIGYLVDLLATSGEIERGTTIAGVDVGGLTPDEAKATLAGEFAAAEQPVELRADQDSFVLDPVAAGLTVDLDGTVAAAGTRSANPFVRIGSWFGAGAETPLVTTVDAAALDAQLATLAGQVDIAPVEGAVTVDGVAVVVVDPVTGRTLDVTASADAVTAVWSQDPRQLAGTQLVTTAQPVRASATGTAAAAAEAQTLLAGPLTLQANGATLTTPVENLAAAVTVAPDTADGFTVALDTAGVRATYQARVEATQTQPADATVGIVGGAPVVNPAQDGLTVDWAATDAALDPALRADRVLTVVYTHTPAGVPTETAQAYGINEVIGEFSTGGFASDSGQNIKRVAEEVQGAIVLPGETFSLNGYTGKRGVEEGYVEAGIIQEGVASRAVGGGISQFATTLFNASYFAGMEDVEHQTHSYYISRYPPGREATVFENPDGSSVIDLQFKNSYPTAILIQTEWTPSDLTVRIWGTKTVEVESIAGERYGYTAPPSKTIPYGQTCKASGGTEGFSIDVTRVIRDLAGTELSRVTTTTSYNGQMQVTCAPPPTPAPTEPPPAPTG